MAVNTASLLPFGAARISGRKRARISGTITIDELYARWLDLGHNLGSVTVRARRIAQTYGPVLFREAVELMVEKNLVDLGALESACDQLVKSKKSRAPVQLNLGAHVPDRDMERTALEVFDER